MIASPINQVRMMSYTSAAVLLCVLFAAVCVHCVVAVGAVMLAITRVLECVFCVDDVKNSSIVTVTKVVSVDELFPKTNPQDVGLRRVGKHVMRSPAVKAMPASRQANLTASAP